MKFSTVNVKSIYKLLLICTLVVGINSTNASVKQDNYSSLVIVKVTGLNGDLFNKISAGINKEATLSLEYSCLESDIVILKYHHTFNEKGDVQHYINNKFAKWVKGVKVEFVYVDMTMGGSSKC